jgi:hypothetical protein
VNKCGPRTESDENLPARQEIPENPVNVYTCSNGHETITTHVDGGTTPFLMQCKKDGCLQISRSACHRVDQNRVAEWEWFRPDTMTEVPGMLREHVSMGGLLIRKKRAP